MPLLDKVFQYQSVSIVGMEKNTGKTECLKYILAGSAASGRKVGITSIGIDGESCDQVTGTAKPQIVLQQGMLFVTSEKFFHEKKLAAEIIDVSDYRTALGRLVTARAITPGKVILSGPTSTGRIREVLRQMRNYGAETCFVDGALSRKSLGSPAVTDSMILTTGAALSPHLPELIKKTTFVFRLINIEKFVTHLENQLLEMNNGIWALDDSQQLHDLNIHSALLLAKNKSRLFQFGHTLFVSGIVSDNLLNTLRMQPDISKTQIIVKDFTKIFVSPESLNVYLQKGGRISVLLRPQLIGVCLNPTSPSGYTMNSEQACNALSERLGIPVWDIRRT